jgi:hypothetical protein
MARGQDANVKGIGHPRDETVIKEVAACFEALGRDPKMKGRRSAEDSSKVLARAREAHARALAASGRRSDGAPVRARADGAVVDVDLQGASAVLGQSAISSDLAEERKKRRRLATPAMVPTGRVRAAIASASSAAGSTPIGLDSMEASWRDLYN